MYDPWDWDYNGQVLRKPSLSPKEKKAFSAKLAASIHHPLLREILFQFIKIAFEAEPIELSVMINLCEYHLKFIKDHETYIAKITQLDIQQDGLGAFSKAMLTALRKPIELTHITEDEWIAKMGLPADEVKRLKDALRNA